MRLQELKNKEDVRYREATGKRVRILLQSSFYLLDGDWQWPMEADAVFCSDVMFSPPEEFIGTRAIFHPDDVASVKESLSAGGAIHSLSFRIITTYGEVKTITGENIVAVEELPHDWQEQAVQAAAQSEVHKAEQIHLHLLKSLDEKTSRFSSFGRWYYNAATHQTWYADFVYTLHGLPAQSLNAHLHTFHPFVHPDDRAFVLEYTDKSLRDKVPLHMDYRIIAAGQEKWVSYKAQWFYSDKGDDVLGGIFQDITEQKAAEREVESYKNLVHFQRQQLLYDEQQLAVGHWQINLLTRKTTYSDQYYRIFGLKPHSLSAALNAFLNYVHPDDRGKVEASYKQIIYEHAVQDLEYRIVRNDGKTRYLLQKGRLVTLEQELIVSGIIQDVTVQRMLEKKVAEQADTLQLRQYLTQQSDEQTALLSWVMDLDENAINWSESFYKLIGQTKVQAANVTEKTLFSLVHSQDIKAFRQQWHLAIAERQPVSFDVRLLVRGVVQYMKAVFNFYQLSGKEYFIGTLQNTTAEQVLQQQLSQRVQLAESLSENTLDRVIITDTHNTVLLWNRSCEQTYGVKKGEAIGENFFDLFPELKTEEEMLQLQRVLRGDRVVKEGTATAMGRGYYNLYLVPLYNGGEVSGILHIIHDVTKELELRNSLYNRLQLIEGLVQSSVDRIIALDRNLNYLYWNKSAETYYGLAKEEVLGRNILEVFPRMVNDPSYNEIRKALRGETVYVPANPEEEAYFETYLTPIKDEKGEVVSLLWMAHDLSKEWELEKEQRRAIQILNTINDFYIELDAAGRFRYLNRRAEEVWQRKREDLLGRQIWEVFPQGIGSGGYNIIQKALTEKVEASGEYYSTVMQRWVYMSAVPTTNGVVALFHDITEARETQQKIAESHRLLAAAETVAGTGSYEVDLQSMTFHFSDGMYRLFGEEPQSFAPSLDFIDSRSHPGDIAQVKAVLEQAAIDKKPYSYTRRIYRRDGELRILEAHGSVVCDEQGQAVKFVGLVQDITERKKAEEQLQQQSHYLRRITETVPDMISVMELPSRELHYLNRETFVANGFDPDMMLCKTTDERAAMIYPDDHQRLHDYYQQLSKASDEDVVMTEYRAQDLTGEWKCFSVRGKVFQRDADGTVTHILNAIENITERKAAEEQLRHNTAFIEEITQTTPDLITIHDAVTDRIVYSNNNDFWEGFYSLEEAYTMKDNERAVAMVHPDNLDKAITFVAERRLLQDGEVKEVELKMKSGKWIKIRSKIFKRDEQQKPLQIISFTSDVTLAKNAELEAEKNLAILRHAEELAQIGSWDYNIATGSFQWSEGMYRLFGLPPGSNVSPETYLNHAVEEDRSIAKRIIKNFRRNQQSFEEALHIKRNGEMRLLKIKGSVVSNGEGKPQRIVGVDLDITDIKAAEEKVKETQHWLEQTALASPDAITVYDLQKKQPYYLNNCLAEWLDTTVENLVQMGIDGRLQLIHSDDRLRVLHFNEKLKAATDGQVLTLEYSLHKKDDSLLWIRNRSKVFQRNERGEVTHILSILQDVTEEKAADRVLKSLNASLEKKNQELESKNDEITSFAFVASHDLREPLRKLHTFSNWLLTREPSLSDAGRQSLEKMNGAVKRLDQLIDDILALTKVHVDNERIKKVDLNGLLERLKQEMSEKLELSGATIEAGHLPSIIGAENQLFYLFKNLISNGLKFQASGNLPLISIEAKTTDEFLTISFRDNGIGIAQEHHKKIFEMFRRLHGRHEYEGTGIGLAICRRIMEKHGGKITVQSSEGQGAIFTCWFPAALYTT